MPNSLFLIDTSAWLFSLRKNYIPKIKDRVSHLLKESEVLTTNIIRLELLGGTKNRKEFQRLKVRLEALQTIEMENPLWEKAYHFAFDVRRKGITIPYTDILISVCAIQAKATLVHADSHYDIIASLIGLEVESFVQTVRDENC